MSYKPVPFDPELVPGLANFLAVVERIPLRADTIVENRQNYAATTPPMEQIVAGRAVEWEDRVVPGARDQPDVTVTIVRPVGGPAVGAAGIYGIHGGGMILGSRFTDIERLIQAALDYGTLGVAVEYRLAPENPAPAAPEDCYLGYVWMVEHAWELGIDPARIIVSGFSAGGGLSAALALMVRDRGAPPALAHYVGAPMLDDRNTTVSTYQFDGVGAWDRNNNLVAWTAVLGDARGGDDVSPYAAPARATDVSGLPPLYLDVGSAEALRDEAVEFASRVWAAGGRAELHVWGGGYHGFQGTPGPVIAGAANAAKDSWFLRVLERQIGSS